MSIKKNIFSFKAEHFMWHVSGAEQKEGVLGDWVGVRAFGSESES